MYKQAWILRDNFKEIGIKCVYNNRNRNVYLTYKFLLLTPGLL